MSAPNTDHIDVIDIGAMALLDALRNDETNWLNQRYWDPTIARTHFEHVLSKLTAAGYGVVEREELFADQSEEIRILKQDLKSALKDQS